MANEPKIGKLAIDRYDANLTTRTDDSYGKVQLRGTVNEDDLANDIVASGTEISPTTIRAVIDLYEKAKVKRVFDGFSVNTRTVRMYPTCQGTFIGEMPTFERPKQRIVVNCTQGALIREGCEKVEVIVNPVVQTGPFINKVIDTFTGEENGTITKGRTIKCEGSKLSILGDHEDVGFYLIKSGSEAETRIKIDPRDFVVNQPSKLIINLPADLADGEYFVEIITQFRNNQVLTKTPLTSRFPQPLTVGNPPAGGDDIL